MDLNIARVIASIASERRALAKRERELIARLNRTLPAMGYRVVASDGRTSATPRAAASSSRGGLRPARKSLKCPHCERRFAQPLHLGRHLSTTHKGSAAKATASGEMSSAKTQAKATKKRKRARRRASRRAAASKS